MNRYSAKTGNGKSFCATFNGVKHRAVHHLFTCFPLVCLTAIPAEALKVALGEEIFNMCYEEDGHILRVVGGALHDFLNSFNVLLKQSKQSSMVPNPDSEDCVNEPSVLCLDKDPGLLTVYFFNPGPSLG